MAARKRIDINALYKVLLETNKPVLMQSEFHSILKKNKAETVTLSALKSAVADAELIKKVTLKSEGYKDVSRYCIPVLNPAPYHYAVSLRGETYLCHASAMNILGLTQ